MKILVDTDLCEANAICMGCCPEVFRVEEDDTLTQETIARSDLPRWMRQITVPRGR